VRKYFDRFVNLTENQYFMAVVIFLFVLMTVFPQIYSLNGFEYLSYLFTGIGGIIIVFTFFRRKAVLFSQETKLGSTLQYVGRRTLDIYLIHYFFLPYHIKWLGNMLQLYDNKLIEAMIALSLALVVMAVSLLVSEVLRLSPFLAHYLFGARR
jgi:fucose 4-O-acetylase-like acetyltransferase